MIRTREASGLPYVTNLSQSGAGFLNLHVKFGRQSRRKRRLMRMESAADEGVHKEAVNVTVLR